MIGRVNNLTLPEQLGAEGVPNKVLGKGRTCYAELHQGLLLVSYKYEAVGGISMKVETLGANVFGLWIKMRK